MQWRVALGVFDIRSVHAGPLVLFTDYSDMFNTCLIYQGRHWKWRAGYMRAKVDEFVVSGIEPVLEGLKPVLAELPDGLLNVALETNLRDVLLEQVTLSASFNRGRWSVQGELGVLDFERKFYAGSVGGGYRIGSVTPYVQVGRLYSEARHVPASADQLSPKLDHAFGHIVNIMRNSASQTVFSLGGRWDATSSIAFKLQWDMRRVGENRAYLWLETPGVDHDRYINTLSLQMDFIF